MRRLALLAPLLFVGCSAAYVQSEFATDVEAARVGTELLAQHAPLLLRAGGGRGAEEGSAPPPAMLQRFRDTLARELEAQGYALTRDLEAAGAELVLGFSTEQQSRTEWQSYSSGRVYYGTEGTVTRVSPGFHYSRPYTVYETWISFSASLYLGERAAPVWTGFATLNGAQRGAVVESTARELLEMLLSGEQQVLEHRIVD